MNHPTTTDYTDRLLMDSLRREEDWALRRAKTALAMGDTDGYHDGLAQRSRLMQQRWGIRTRGVQRRASERTSS